VSLKTKPRPQARCRRDPGLIVDTQPALPRSCIVPRPRPKDDLTHVRSRTGYNPPRDVQELTAGSSTKKSFWKREPSGHAAIDFYQ
jgi:hypothetical protein